MIIYLARHPECEKNRIGIPGGIGTPLTAEGVVQARTLAGISALLDIRRILACPVVQTKEAAGIVAEHLHLPWEQVDALHSIDLGVLTGIPISESLELFPASSASMQRWRDGLIEIGDIEVEGMEDPTHFYIRGVKFLLGLLSEPIAGQQRILLVCTTSIMILLKHISDRVTPRKGDGYKVQHYDNAQIVRVEFTDDDIAWLNGEILTV